MHRDALGTRDPVESSNASLERFPQRKLNFSVHRRLKMPDDRDGLEDASMHLVRTTAMHLGPKSSDVNRKSSSL